MWIVALAPFILQALAILFDEFYFHVKRGLPKWERLGHPLDTLSLLVCLLFVIGVPYEPYALKIYGCLAVFSCLMVTKDEFIHKTHCPASENWLHACLFILHPITLAITSLIWPLSQGIDAFFWFSTWLEHGELLRAFLLFQAGSYLRSFSFTNLFSGYPMERQPSAEVLINNDFYEELPVTGTRQMIIRSPC